MSQIRIPDISEIPVSRGPPAPQAPSSSSRVEQSPPASAPQGANVPSLSEGGQGAAPQYTLQDMLNMAGKTHAAVKPLLPQNEEPVAEVEQVATVRVSKSLITAPGPANEGGLFSPGMAMGLGFVALSFLNK